MQIHAQCISSVWVCLNNCTILGKVLYSANTVFSWILKISTGFMCYTCRQLGKKILINEIQEGQHPLTACHQFQATGHPVSRTQASDAMTSRLPRYELKCVQRRCFQCGSVPLRSLCYPLPIYWYHAKGNWLRYNFAAESFHIMKLCSRLFVLYCRNCPKDDKFR